MEENLYDQLDFMPSDMMWSSPFQLVLRHLDLGSTLESVGRSAEERSSVGVKGLVSGGGSLEELAVLVDQGDSPLGSLSLLEESNDGLLEAELDQVEGEVPDNVPDPDNTDPATRDGGDVGEVPVSEASNDRRNELGDTESNHERNRWSLHPGESVGSSDKDERLRDDGNLKVNDHVALRVIAVLANGVDVESVLEELGAVHDGEQSNGGGGEVQTVADTVRKDLGKIPRVGSGRWQDSVDGQCHDSTVVEQSNDQDHEGREVEFPDEGHKRETDDNTDGDGTSVDGVVPHTLENDTRTVNGVDDGRKTRLGQDNVGSTTSGIGSTFDGNTDVGSGESGSIVGTVTSHGAQVTETLNTLDNLELVLGENTSKSVGVHDHLIEVSVLAAGDGTVLENLGGVHVVTETETSTSFLGDSELITSDHLDLDTEGHGIVDGLLGVGTGRVENGQETNKLETVTLRILLRTQDILVGDSQGSETTEGELLDIGLELVLHLRRLVSGAQFDDDTSHTLGGTLDLASISVVSVGDLSSLVDGVEWLEVKELNTLTSHGWVGQGTDDTAVDGILVLGSGSVGSKETDALDVPGGVAFDVLLVDGELVGGQCTGLVGTQDGDTSKFLDGSDTGNDSLVLGELLSTDSEGDGQHGRHGDGNTTDQKHKDVVKTTSVGVLEGRVKNNDLENDEGTDRAETEETDSGQNHLQVTGLVVVLTDEGSGTTEEGVGTGGDDDTLSLTLFTGGTRKALVTDLLAGGQRFAGKSSLVHADEVSNDD